MAAAREVGRISVRVVPDTDGFRRALKRQLEAITKGLEAKVDVDPDLKGFRQKVNAATKGLDHAKVKVDVDKNSEILRKNGFHTADETIKLKLDPKFDYMLRQRLKKMDAVKVPVEPDVKTFRTRFATMMSKLKNRLSEIEPPSFGSGINATGYALIASTISLLSPVIIGLLGALTTGLLALPGIITAIVTPIGALVLGLDGLKKAAGVLEKPFKELRDTMSAKVEEQFTPVFEKLKDIFPTLKSALPSVTQGLADMAKSFADVLIDPANLAKLDQTIRNIASGLTAAAPGIRDFTQGFLDLINGFSTKLPDIGKWFSDTGASFSKWVKDFTTAGPDGVSKFDVALKGLGDTLKILGGGLVNIAGRVLDFFSNPEKVEGFKKELQAIVTLIEKLVGLLVIAANAVSDFLNRWDRITSMSPADMLSGMFTGLQQIIGSLTASIITELSQIPTQLATAWSSIPAIAQSAWNGVVQTVSGALTGVLNVVINGGFQIVGEVTTWPGKIAAALAGLFQAGFDAGAQLVQGFINGISGMIDSAVAKAREMAQRVKDAVTDFLGIHSPSTVMAAIGGFIGDGLINGMKAKQGEIEKTAQSIGQTVKDAFDWSGYAQRGLDAGFAFAGANADQFMSDLGIGGKGLLSQLGEQGLKFGMDFAGKALTQNFFTSNVDDTIAVKNNQLNKQALGVVGKSG
ncbi:Phage-related protein [Mycobacteroides abscessus]|uniref:cation transporter n=1 Tax=Mycobacteroides abscessus TaxID=36809 RepID=UPI0005E3F6E9|nr:cation transporter [Mycobacteroides abscessus]CPU26750.1 Phage-related protein [Mycobacteroides abscessus]CPU27883.1 Phage-related protein [Mycobacteroides abscessus]CPU33532.1 Phage-related protein [Mycobacteroides abscessus]CPV34785.1 Phage-related protein [Mycobacteroides abscessus]